MMSRGVLGVGGEGEDIGGAAGGGRGKRNDNEAGSGGVVGLDRPESTGTI